MRGSKRVWRMPVKSIAFKNIESPEANFAKGVELDIGFAHAAIRIVCKRLSSGVAELEPDPPSLLTLENRAQFG
jgi:hypothetical protein